MFKTTCSINRHGSFWLRKPNPQIMGRSYASAEELRAAWRQLLNTPSPVAPQVPATPVCTEPANYYADPAQTVPQAVSWQGIVLEWPTWDEQCPTPWNGESTVASPELTEGVVTP